MSLDLEREQVVQALCAHYAADRLTTSELEARFELVYRSQDAASIRTALNGLPAAPRPAGAPTPAPLYEPPRAPAAFRDRERRFLGFFSEVKKEGVWTAPAFSRVRAIFGTVILDLREADIPAEGMLIDAEATLGEIRILLPLGVGADVDCTAVMGEVTEKTQPGTPGLPRVVVRGGATLGTIKVETKLPKKAKLESWRESLKGFLGTGT
jgi:hypothetical protein